MLEFSLTLVRLPDGRLRIRCEYDQRSAESEVDLPRADRLGDLLQQTRSGAPPAAAFRALGETLGGLLFAGEAGDLAREALREDPEAVVHLATDADLAGWPWELAYDAALTRFPVADGAALVRIAGRAAAPPTPSAHGVLVVPEAAGRAWVQSLQSATRHLARKAGLDIFPAEPASAPALRRALARGAALVHVAAQVVDGRVSLDDGPASLERLGFGSDTWLLVVGGSDATQDVGPRLRERDVPIVLARQFSLRPNESAAIDRELYRALAGGATVAGAVRRVRRALQRSGAAEFVWAAPVLWSAPRGREPAPALQPFPPAGLTAESSEVGGVQRGAEAKAPDPAPYPDLLGPPGAPLRAPAFIQETIRLIGQARPEDGPDAELQARTTVMHTLGAGASVTEAESGLTPDERTHRLVDRLVGAIGRPDLPLRPPADLAQVVDRCARRTAVGRDGVRQAIRAALAGRAVWLDGPPGVGKGRLARSLAEDVFGYHPRVVHGESADGGRGPEGGLYRVVASNWRADEVGLDGAAPPTTRMPLVSRLPGSGYVTHHGGWLIVLGAHRLPRGELYGMLAGVGAGVLEGRTDGHDYRLPLPADFRVLLCGHAPSGLPGWVPVVSLDYADDAATEEARWLAAAELRLGPAGDAGETLARRRGAEVIANIVRFGRVATPVSSDVGLAALAYAIESGETIVEAVDEALCLYLAPRLADLDARRVSMLLAYLGGDTGGVFDALLGGKGPDLGAAMALARQLDRVAPEEEEDTTRAERLAASVAGAGRLELTAIVDGWRKTGGLTTPGVELPRLREHLVSQQHGLR